jgi:hypothetical protein
VGCLLISLVLAGQLVLREYRKERAAFATRIGLAADDPDIARAYEKLSIHGRSQIQTPADLTRLLREREHYDAQRVAKATRKDRERAKRMLFL